jgi:hypothetical protein
VGLVAVVTAVAPAAFAGSGGGSSSPTWLGDVPGLGATAPDRWPGNVSAELRHCTISNPLLPDDPARVRAFVPAHYALGTNAFFGPAAATLIAVHLACVDDGNVGAAAVNLTLLAVQVQPDAQAMTDVVNWAWTEYTRSTLNVLPSSSWYVLGMWTDDIVWATELHRARIPVTFTGRIRAARDDIGLSALDSVDVAGALAIHSQTRLPDPFVHNHDWFFWHDVGPHGPTTGLLLHLHAMSDSSCGYHASPVFDVAPLACHATVRAPAGSRLADYLGGTSRDTPYAFNHPPTDVSGSGYLQVFGDETQCPAEESACAQS